MAEDGVEHGRARGTALRADATGRPGRPRRAASAAARRRPRPDGSRSSAPRPPRSTSASPSISAAAYGADVRLRLGQPLRPRCAPARARRPRCRRRGRRDQGRRDRRRRRGGRRGAESRSFWPATTSCRSPARPISTRSWSGLPPRRSRARWWACERAPLPGTAAARRRRGAAVVEGADGARARRDGTDADAGLRPRAPGRGGHGQAP